MSEIFNSEEMRLFEKGEFSKKKSYFFMLKAGKSVFEFINANFKKENPIGSTGSVKFKKIQGCLRKR